MSLKHHARKQVNFSGGAEDKNLPAMQETWVRPLGWEDLLEKEMTTIAVFLPGESHGWRSLMGYSPWGRKELDTTERFHFTSLPATYSLVMAT